VASSRVGQKFAFVAACVVLAAPAAKAQSVADLKGQPVADQKAPSVAELKAQMELMQKQMLALQKKLDTVSQTVQQQDKKVQKQEKSITAQKQEQDQAMASAARAVPASSNSFLQRKPGAKDLTFLTPNGEFSLYGNLDVSFDVTTKGIRNMTNPADPTDVPIGNLGWMPAISTNLSYVGLRGFQRLGNNPVNFVWQLETEIAIAAASGTAETNSNQSNVVKGGLTSRNSFIGFASKEWGAVKIGKTDAPYKTSTARMNPFVGMLGDYSVIMGNTGGDNRVEFGTRMEHSIWYESPNLNGFTFNVLFSPGQNRASNSDNIAAGASDCSGGNTPSSGGFTSCADGSFRDAVSTNVAFEKGPLYLTAAYERHFKVNRSSDIGDPVIAPLDVADEDAWKVGAQFKILPGTTIGGIFESMRRYVPGVLAVQNERQRNGTWLTISQQLTPDTSLYLGWAHAFRAVGDPGQHNTPALDPSGLGTANANNSADMITAALKHNLSENLLTYINVAATLNSQYAHYDLGAGGRAVTTDCHDANGSQGGINANPHCWAGGHLYGVSTGVQYKF
jgi:predicted porin